MSSGYGSMPPSNDPSGQPPGGGYGQGGYGQGGGQGSGYGGGYGGQGGYGQPAGSPPPNYLVFAILTTLFCCLPLGIVSIVYSAQVNSKWSGGDYQGAKESSDNAKKWAIWSAIAGVVVAVLYVVFVVAIGASMFPASS